MSRFRSLRSLDLAGFSDRLLVGFETAAPVDATAGKKDT
jgi:hypothetical protein